MTLRIRRMKPDEVSVAATVWHRSRTADAPWIREGSNPSLTEDLVAFRRDVARECEVWLAFAGDACHGLMAWRDERVQELFVLPAAQRRGVGTALLEKAMELMPGGFWLRTDARNAGARAFYRARGLRVVGRETGPPPFRDALVRFEWRPPATDDA